MTPDMPDADRAEQLVVEHRPRARNTVPRILVTNDDGIDSPGITLLARRLAEDFEVVVAAPEADMSGTGTGIGRFDPRVGVALHRAEVDSLPEAFTVAGPPGLAVMAGALGAFGDPPDLVVSGPNAGVNTGHSIIHSGTVGAALTARTFGSHGIAVSLASSDPWQWDTAVTVARAAVDWILRRDGSSRSVLNINVPALPLDEVEGVRWAAMDDFGHFRVAIADIPGEKLQFEMSGSEREADTTTDTWICRQGRVALTLLPSLGPAVFPAEPATTVWSPDGA